jgi:hypothetical protein
MKQIIEFELPKDKEDLEICLSYSKMHNALWEFKDYLRSKIKYDDLTQEERDIYEKIREEFF